MRIRSIKPEFWRSTDISNLSIEDRLLFIGLWSYVDDNGVGRFDTAIIAADLFAHDLARDPIETLSRVSTGCNRLAGQGLLTLYRSENQDFVFITNWEAHQRVNNPNKPRFPRPDAENATLLRPDVDPKENLPPGTGEQGNRGTGEQGYICASPTGERVEPEPDLDSEFAEWYSHYPRKRGRGQALKAYRTARNKTDAQTLLDALQAQIPMLMAKGSELCPYPSTWLNGERWDDDMNETPAQQQPSRSGYRSQNDIMREMQQQARTQPNPLTLIEGGPQ